MFDFNSVTMETAPVQLGSLPSEVPSAFIDGVKRSHENGEWLAMTLPRTGETTKRIARDGTIADTGTDEIITDATRLLRAAAAQLRVSVKVKTLATDDENYVIVQYLAVDRIARPRKNKDEVEADEKTSRRRKNADN